MNEYRMKILPGLISRYSSHGEKAQIVVGLIILFRQFLPAPLHFSSCTPQFCKFQNWPSPVIWIRDLGVCYGFINPEVNHVVFRMREYSGSKICKNCWFSDCWIRKPNFYYRLVDPEWFFSIMDFWIYNAYFELWIGGSRMVFSIMDVLHFFILD